MRTTTMLPRVRHLEVHKGPVGEPADQAHRAIAAVIRAVREPVLFTSVRLSRSSDPTTPNLVVAQADLDLIGRNLRVRVTGPTQREAVDLLAEELRRRLEPPVVAV